MSDPPPRDSPLHSRSCMCAVCLDPRGPVPPITSNLRRSTPYSVMSPSHAVHVSVRTPSHRHVTPASEAGAHAPVPNSGTRPPVPFLPAIPDTPPQQAPRINPYVRRAVRQLDAPAPQPSPRPTQNSDGRTSTLAGPMEVAADGSTHPDAEDLFASIPDEAIAAIPEEELVAVPAGTQNALIPMAPAAVLATAPPRRHAFDTYNSSENEGLPVAPAAAVGLPHPHAWDSAGFEGPAVPEVPAAAFVDLSGDSPHASSNRSSFATSGTPHRSHRQSSSAPSGSQRSQQRASVPSGLAGMSRPRSAPGDADVTLPSVPPIGAFRRGANGPLTVLHPRLYGSSREGVSLLNTLTSVSGSISWQVSNSDRNNTTVMTSEDEQTEMANLQMQQMQAMGVIASDVSHTTSSFFAPIVRQAFSRSLRQIQVTNLDHAGKFATFNTDGTVVPKFNQKGDFIFIPFMIYNKRMSTVNRRDEPEFINDPARPNGKRYNTGYWNNHMEVKHYRGTRQRFSTIEFGALIPEWAVPAENYNEHCNAASGLAEAGGFVPGTNLMFMSLKTTYAYIFTKTMESSLVARARELYWSPVFVLKNAALLKSDFGVNSAMVTTLNTQPKSFLSLLGFCKVNDPSNPRGSVTIISLVNENNNMLSLDLH